MSINKVNLFSIPLYSITLNLDLNNLKKDLYEIKSKTNGRVVSNQGGWQSTNLKYNTPFLKDLIKTLNLCIWEVFNQQCNITELWGNISPKYGYNNIHLHGPIQKEKWSGVIYIQFNKESGNIVFYNDQFPDSHQEIIPHNNQLLIFPAYLAHFVQPNLSDEDRISIAFNFDLI